MNTKISTNQLLMFAFSLGVWWLLLGSIQMALGFFALIFVHEMGHVIAAKQKGLAVTMPTFTPFGAYVQTERCRSASDEAYVKFGGPFIGGLASLVTMVAGSAIGSDMMIQVGVMGVFLNLFNLIPLDPMDGGGMTQAVSKWFWLVGAAMLAYVLFFVVGLNVFNIIIGVLIGQQAYESLGQRAMQRSVSPSYFAVPLSSKLVILASHIGLASGLAWVLFNKHAFLSFFSAWF
ncbi:MAG: site-2 protease family protein [Candidatus Obscuribacterales bacterium]|jgi:Zn-dependent protease